MSLQIPFIIILESDFTPPLFGLLCKSLIFYPGVKLQSISEFLHKTGVKKDRFSCTSKMPIAREAPVYGLSRDSAFAEDTILDTRLMLLY